MSSIDYTSRDYESLREALLNLASEKLPEWTDHSPNDLGVVLLELIAHMGDSLFYHQDRIAGESFLETAVERRSVVQLLRLIGYELKPPAAASADLTLLFKPVPDSSKESATIHQYDTFQTASLVPNQPLNFQYIEPEPINIAVNALPMATVNSDGSLRLLTPTEVTGQKPQKEWCRVYRTVPVRQVDARVDNEIVASSDGSPFQRYRLKRSPIIDCTLVVKVSGAEWKRVPSPLKSEANDHHYAVRRDENDVIYLEFGDGIAGMRPPRGQNNIIASYLVGGGTKGNVPPLTISKVVKAGGLGDLLKGVRNVLPASGGADAEALPDAVRKGPLLYRTMRRAVTASDYEELVMNYPGVAKVLARSEGVNTIVLTVAPAGGGVVSQTLKEDLLVFLDTQRMMTTSISIVDPLYTEICIDATVTVLPQFSQRLVQQQVETVVRQHLAFDKVTFGQPLYVSKLYELIQDLDGVRGLFIRTLARKDRVNPKEPIPPSGMLSFDGSKGELPTWSGFTVVAAQPATLPDPDGTLSHLVMQGGAPGG